MRDKKRFVLKTFSHLKSINLFYLGTSSKDEITELTDEQRPHRYQRKMDPVTFMAEDEMGLQPLPRPVPPFQGDNFCVTLGASLAGAVSALALATTQETWCKRQWG